MSIKDPNCFKIDVLSTEHKLAGTRTHEFPSPNWPTIQATKRSRFAAVLACSDADQNAYIIIQRIPLEKEGKLAIVECFFFDALHCASIVARRRLPSFVSCW